MTSTPQQVILQSCKTALREVERRVAAAGGSINPDVKSVLSVAMSALRSEINATKNSSSSSSTGSHGSFVFSSALMRDGSVLTVLLSSLLWKKRKVAEASLTALRSLFPCPAFQVDARVTLFRHLTVATASSSSSAAAADHIGPSIYHCAVGEGLFIALSHLLSNTSESALQLRAVQFIQRVLATDRGSRHLVGRAVPDTVGACFAMAMQASQDSVRAACRHTLSVSLQRVTKAFVLESSTPPGAVQAFATTTVLENYTVDVEHDAPFQPIVVVDSSTLLASGATHVQPSSSSADGGGGAAAAAAMSVEGEPAAAAAAAVVDAPVFPDHTLDPNAIFSRSEDEVLLGLATHVLNRENRLPTPLKDFIVVLKHACRLASLPCTGSISESNNDVRARELGLEMLELVLHELPVANNPLEHPCAMWLSLAFASCRYNLMCCLTLNFSSIQPFTFFASAIRIVTQLFRKFHHYLARELNSLLTCFLLPVVGSRYASFQQKHAVVSMIHTFFSVPHLIISFFINYDCNPSFDAGGINGGVLEQLIDFVTEMIFMDSSASTVVTTSPGTTTPVPAGGGAAGGTGSSENRGSLTADQEALLRCECLISMHALVQSLYRWTTEDPKTYAMRYLKQSQAHEEKHLNAANPSTTAAASAATAAHQTRTCHHYAACALDTNWSELYLDNWESSDEEEYGGNNPVGETHSTVGTDSSLSRNVSFTVINGKDALTPLWGKNHNVLYHWKHVHYLWHNKRILQEAVSLTNRGKWRDAVNFLTDRLVLPRVEPEAAAHPTINPEEDQKDKVTHDRENDEVAETHTEEMPEADRAGDARASEEEEEEEEVYEPGTTPYAPFARFLHEFPGILREAICRIFERINKDVANKQVLVEYLHLFDYRGVPIDVALRDTTCKFMSWDRPMFEAGVWETIQRLFGSEYARQNPGSITANDADTMAGVLLFLHANLHNAIAKGSRMSCKTFVEDGNACLDFPMEERDIAAMYERVARHKWELDDFGRTPQQQEAAKSGLMQLSTKIRYERAVARSAEQLTRDLQFLNQHIAAEAGAGTAPQATPAVETIGTPQEAKMANESATSASGRRPGSGGEDTARVNKADGPLLQRVDQSVLQEVLRDVQHQGNGSVTNSFASTAHSSTNFRGHIPPPASTAASASTVHDDIGYLDSTVPNYCTTRDTLRLRDVHQQQFVEVAFAQLAKLESVHRQFFCRGDRYHPQPYIVPYYAEHVKLILVSAYPQIVASLYMGFRVLDEGPIRRQLTDTMQLLFELAAAFVMNISDLREVVNKTIQEYLGEEQAYRLFPPSRPTLVSFFLNYI